MKTKYQMWMEQQDKDFIKQIHLNEIIPEKFKDDGRNVLMDITHLEKLDEYFINPEGK